MTVTCICRAGEVNGYCLVHGWWRKHTTESVGASQPGEAKPCPFCGTLPDEIRDAEANTFSIRCGCLLHPGMTWPNEHKHEAIARWNTRAGEGELERLREELRVEKALRSEDLEDQFKALDRAEAAEAEVAALRERLERAGELVCWLLGEGESFPDRPEKIEGKPHPLYWWRTELRQRATEIGLLTPAPGEAPHGE